MCKATQANSKVGTVVKPQAAGDKMGMEWGAAAAASALLQGQAGRGGRGTPPGRRAAVPRQHPAASFVEAAVRAAGGPPGL